MADQVDTHHLYVNCEINNPISATSSIPCNFLKQFGVAFLDNTANWKGSIVRFSLPINALPYFTVQANYYKITLSYNGSDYPAFVVPTSVDNATFNVYYIQQFVDAVNAAINTAYTALTTAVGLSNQFYPNRAPFFSFDAKSNLLSLTTDAGSWETGTPSSSPAPGTPRIWMNTPLAALFEDFPQITQATNSASGKDSYIMIAARGPAAFNNPTPVTWLQPTDIYVTSAGANIPANSAFTTQTVVNILTSLPSGATILFPLMCAGSSTTAGLIQPIGSACYMSTLTQASGTGAQTLHFNTIQTTWGTVAANGGNVFWRPPSQLVTTEETPSVVSWWTTQSIIVTTSMIPARTEMVQAAGQGDYGMARVVSDFYIPPLERIAANNSLLYLPSAQYRWFDMMEQEKLRELDLQFYAGDATGLQTSWKPIQINPGQTASVKILFQHRCVTDHKARDRPTKRQRLEGGALPLLLR